MKEFLRAVGAGLTILVFSCPDVTKPAPPEVFRFERDKELASHFSVLG
jgi:hypothetical protein